LDFYTADTIEERSACRSQPECQSCKLQYVARMLTWVGGRATSGLWELY